MQKNLGLLLVGISGTKVSVSCVFNPAWKRKRLTRKQRWKQKDRPVYGATRPQKQRLQKMTSHYLLFLISEVARYPSEPSISISTLPDLLQTCDWDITTRTRYRDRWRRCVHRSYLTTRSFIDLTQNSYSVRMQRAQLLTNTDEH